MPDREWLIPALARGILESAMDAIITVDEAHRVVLFNAAAEQVFGVPQSEALGSPLDRFIPERYRAAHGQFTDWRAFFLWLRVDDLTFDTLHRSAAGADHVVLGRIDEDSRGRFR